MAKSGRRWLQVAVAALALFLSVGAACAAEGASEGQMFARGAILWGHYCGYCHKPRPGTEFNRVQWKILMMHMRVRANLPADDARAILVFLQGSH